MNPAFIPAWILLAPLAFVVADWLFSPKASSMANRQDDARYSQPLGMAAR